MDGLFKQAYFHLLGNQYFFELLYVFSSKLADVNVSHYLIKGRLHRRLDELT